MSSITDQRLYTALFGKKALLDGDVIDFSEHGRAGGLNTGQGFKYINIVGETKLVDEPDANTTYVGKCKLGSSAATDEAIWQIKKISISGNVTTINYADGNDNYDNVWDNRAALSYA